MQSEFGLGLVLCSTLSAAVVSGGQAPSAPTILPAFAPIQFEADPSSAPANQISAEYAFLRLLSDGGGNTPIGWNVSYVRNLNPAVGIVGEIGTSFENEGNVSAALWDLMGGVRLSSRGNASFTPYFEALGGVAVVAVTDGFVIETFTEPAMQIGGGVDFNLNPNIAIRVGADYRAIFDGGESINFLRVRGGVVFGFGGRVGGQRFVPEERSAPMEPPSSPPPEPVSRPPAAEPRALLPVETAPPEPPEPELVPAPAPPPPAPEPPPPPPPPAPVVSDYERGVGLVRDGNFELAAVAFTVHLRQENQNQYTTAIGLFCDRNNLAARVVDSGYAPELFILSVPRGSQTCFGMYWGLYASRDAAQRGIESMPSAFRAGGPVVMPLTRVVK